jgi:MoaA/NifB/PqqE/SkfB family radical SAM enzyme
MIGQELSLVPKLYQQSVQVKIKELILGKGKSLSPWVVELDPTTACNLACHDCISANLLNQGGFERERLKEVAKEFKTSGVKAVVLIGGGEPMAHPEFGNIVDYFSDNGLHVGVTSNGTMIKRYLDQLAYKTKWIRISVDAGTPEIFQLYRPHASGKSQFNSVISQMTELAKIKKGKLGYSFLILSKTNKTNGKIITNAVDIYKAAQLAKDIGCNYFEVKPAFDIMHFLNKQNQEIIDIVNSELKKAKKIETDDFRVLCPETINDFSIGKDTQPKDYERCLVSELRTCVTPSGTYVCQYHRGTTNMKIGDSNVDSLSKIWSSERRDNVMQKVNPKIHCKFHCIRHESNLQLEKMLLKKDKTDLVNDYDFFI